MRRLVTGPGSKLVKQGFGAVQLEEMTSIFLDGLITHGSVVAREFGIPAVVGVQQATTRLKTGDCVRVDGNSGRIVVLEG